MKDIEEIISQEKAERNIMSKKVHEATKSIE